MTQNVDGLHEKAGSEGVLHMHGVLSGALCAHCGHRWSAPAEMRVETPCPACTQASVRPVIVWFGEAPHGLDRIAAELHRADVVVAIGPSGRVCPAAGFSDLARPFGAYLVNINLDPADPSTAFDQVIGGPATQTVPA